jgi:hypothetical protein
MSKGLSGRQGLIINSIARQIRKDREQRERMNAAMIQHGHPAVVRPDKPVAWRAIDYGPSTASENASGTPDEGRAAWNIEQALRRSLRTLEQRGLVTLGRYCFRPDADMPRGTMSPSIFWTYVHPDHHVIGESRFMTGVLLTEAGWAIADAAQARIDKQRAKNARLAARRQAAAAKD